MFPYTLTPELLFVQENTIMRLRQMIKPKKETEPEQDPTKIVVDKSPRPGKHEPRGKERWGEEV